MFGSSSYTMSFKNILWSLVRPVRSADSVAENRLRLWHEKKDGAYVRSDNKTTSAGHTIGSLRNLFPEDSSTSKNRLSKALILDHHNRLMKIGIIAQGTNGRPSELHADDCDYDLTWKQQPRLERFLWTIRYRRPYTTLATLLKWGAESAIVAGTLKAIYEFKKWYFNK